MTQLDQMIIDKQKEYKKAYAEYVELVKIKNEIEKGNER